MAGQNRTQTLVLIILVGMVTALAVELSIHATGFGESLEAFDTVIPVASIGLAWLFYKPKE